MNPDKESERQERLADLYAEMPRDRLVEAGRQHLAGNLHLRARRQRRWMWLVGIVLAAVATFAAILACVYALEKTRESADRFERSRSERMRQQGLEADP